MPHYNYLKQIQTKSWCNLFKKNLYNTVRIEFFAKRREKNVEIKTVTFFFTFFDLFLIIYENNWNAMCENTYTEK